MKNREQAPAMRLSDHNRSQLTGGYSSSGMEHINFALSRSDLENLLSGLLFGSLNVDLKIRLTALGDLPPNCSAYINSGDASGPRLSVWALASIDGVKRGCLGDFETA
jgi:hypothetical protein